MICHLIFLFRKKIFRRESIKNNRLNAYLHLKNVFKTNYDRENYLNNIQDIITIQTQFRMCLAKQEFEKLKKMKKEEEHINDIIKENELLKMKIIQQKYELEEKEKNDVSQYSQNVNMIKSIKSENVRLKNNIQIGNIINKKNEETIKLLSNESREQEETQILMTYKLNKVLIKHDQSLKELRRLRYEKTRESKIIKFLKRYL